MSPKIEQINTIIFKKFTLSVSLLFIIIEQIVTGSEVSYQLG